MKTTKIEWTGIPGHKGVSWNPITGCTPFSDGCAKCWAKLTALRFKGKFGYPKENPFTPGVIHENEICKPYKWEKRRCVATCLMGDFFHENISPDDFERVFRVIIDCNSHTFILCTKRINMAANLLCGDVGKRLKKYAERSNKGWPLRHLWFLVTTENQETFNARAPILEYIPANVKGVSIEPMLSQILIDYESSKHIDWVIVGGESASDGARPMHPYWVEYIKNQCVHYDIPFFFKQWGSWSPIDENGNNGIIYENLTQWYDDSKYVENTHSVRNDFVDANGLIMNSGTDFSEANYPVIQMFLRNRIKSGRMINGTEYNGFPKVEYDASNSKSDTKQQRMGSGEIEDR